MTQLNRKGGVQRTLALNPKHQGPEFMLYYEGNFFNLFKNEAREMFGKVKMGKTIKRGTDLLLRSGGGGAGRGVFLPCTLKCCCIKCSPTSFCPVSKAVTTLIISVFLLC